MNQRPLYQKIKSNHFYILAVVLIVIAGVYFIYHWFQKDNRNQFASPDDIQRISVEDAYQAVKNGEAILVDTRPLSGYISMHAAGAISLPYDVVAQNLVTIDPDRWYILYCTWANEYTSAREALLMLQAGVKRANPMIGGLGAWIQAGYPTEP